MTGLGITLMGAAGAGTPRSRLVRLGARATVDRALQQLIAAGLLVAEPVGRQTAYRVADLTVADACARLADYRTDIQTDFPTASAVAILLTLPHPWREPAPNLVAGVSRATWHRQVQELAARGLLVGRGEGRPRPNPRSAALAGFVVACHTFLSSLPVRTGAAVRGLQTVHEAGIERAWSATSWDVPDGWQPFGPSSDPEAFVPLVVPFVHAYHGPRILDRWDRLLLFVRAARLRGGGVLDSRVAGWFTSLAATSTPPRRFAARAAFYELDDLWADVRRAVETRSGPVWDASMTLRGRENLPEGYLDRP